MVGRLTRISSIAAVTTIVVGCTAAAGSVAPSTAVTTATASIVVPSSAAPTVEPTPAMTAPATPFPSPSFEVLPDGLDPELEQAIRLRRGYGMRADLAYVREVATDPRATNMEYGVPLYPEEFEETQGRFNDSQALIPGIVGYTQQHPDEFGGVYVDEATHTGVVTLWTAHLAEHAAAIRALVGPDARVAFGLVKYPERDLRELQDQITKEWRAAWLKAIPAEMQGVGVDIHASYVEVEVSSANPDAAAIVEAHFGLGDRLHVTSDGTGAALIPGGTVQGRVEPADLFGRRGLDLRWTSEDPGDCGGGDIGYGVGSDGRFELPCQAGRRTLIVMVEDETGDGSTEVGRATVTVKGGQTVRVTIHLHEP
jgi:hypothetical protein